MQSKKILKLRIFKKILGPLGGVLSAMKWVKQNNKNYQWISTFPSDTPFFKKELLEDFYEKINFNESKLFFIKSNNTRHNIFWFMVFRIVKSIRGRFNKKR